MPAKRVKRPKLERDRPRREWSTLFGADAAKTSRSAATNGAGPGPERNVVSDTVELGYRVIEDYLRQGQQAAQAFGPTSWGGGSSGPGPANGSPDDMQQMAQRVMQYGWDFAGLWFEMWTRMAGANGWSAPTSPLGNPFVPPATPAPTPSVSGDALEVSTRRAVPVSVSVDSPLPTTTSVEIEPGDHAALVVQALRPEGKDGSAIRDVSIERDDGGWQIGVVVEAGQRPGAYRGAIVDAATNLPRGSLLLKVQAKKR
jgi:hypothetical protein